MSDPTVEPVFDAGLIELLGLRLHSHDADRLVITWTVDERHLQPAGIVHGGVYCAVHESAASVAGQLWFGDRGHVVGVANQTDFLRPARAGARLTATATPVHRGRTQQLWLIETCDETGRLIARGQDRTEAEPG